MLSEKDNPPAATTNRAGLRRVAGGRPTTAGAAGANSGKQPGRLGNRPRRRPSPAGGRLVNPGRQLPRPSHPFPLFPLSGAVGTRSQEPRPQSRFGGRPAPAEPGLRLVPEVSGLGVSRRCQLGPPPQRARLAPHPGDGRRSGAQNALRAGGEITPPVGRLFPERHHASSRGVPPGTAGAGLPGGRSAAHHYRRRRCAAGPAGRPAPQAVCAHPGIGRLEYPGTHGLGPH